MFAEADYVCEYKGKSIPKGIDLGLKWFTL